ncbi:hypothetical protein [uncultured Algibacter sp.]
MFVTTVSVQFKPLTGNDTDQRWSLVPEISDEFDGATLNGEPI